jgi:hypothetical protein
MYERGAACRFPQMSGGIATSPSMLQLAGCALRVAPSTPAVGTGYAAVKHCYKHNSVLHLGRTRLCALMIEQPSMQYCIVIHRLSMQRVLRIKLS